MKRYFVKYGLSGYGPDLDPEDCSVSLEDIDSVLCDELSDAADFAEESAHAIVTDSGDYRSAWLEHERAESLEILSANFAPRRRKAPLFADDLPAWLATVESLIAETFPVDVSPTERLYVWEDETEDGEGVN